MNTPPPDLAPAVPERRFAWAVGVLALLCLATGAAAMARTAEHPPARFVMAGPAPVAAAPLGSLAAALQPLEDCAP